jgi:hypothetical protein
MKKIRQASSTVDNAAAVATTQACQVADDSSAPSMEAKRLAAAILEVLAGARGPAEAAQVLGISLCRYYQLEARALDGLVGACESRRRGRKHRSGNDLVALRHECERLQRECGRQQALVRAAQRTVGLAPPPPAAPAPAGSKRRRKRRPVARALKMAALLQSEVASGNAPAAMTAAPEVAATLNPPGTEGTANY